MANEPGVIAAQRRQSGGDATYRGAEAEQTGYLTKVQQLNGAYLHGQQNVWEANAKTEVAAGAENGGARW